MLSVADKVTSTGFKLELFQCDTGRTVPCASWQKETEVQTYGVMR